MTVPTARPGVSIGAGRVLGTREGNIDRFLAIPYAAPPFGERRFAPPAPPEHWEGERDASAFGPTAPQTAYVGGIENHLGSVEIAGDDILTVNVWTPADREAGHPLPVLVFVHGGALSRGTPALGAYDGATFARHGIVYVSIAYRVGSEGFSVLDDAPLNLGLLDQIAALDWVRREIGAFGGDPHDVTAMGHSAGGNTLAALLAHPRAAELFDRVIVQSGPLAALPAAKSGRMTRAVAKKLGVPTTRDGFASKAPAELVAAQTAAAAGGSPLGGGPTFALTIGGEAIARDPYAALRDGAGREIPVLIGTTSEEYRLWFVPSGQLDRISNVTLTVARIATHVSRKAVALYRSHRPGAKPGEILGAIATDTLLRQPLTGFADSRMDAPAPTFVYEFAWRSPHAGMGAAHGMELGFVFDTLDSPDSLAMGGPDGPQALADAMHAAWVSFVKTGNPGWAPWSQGRGTEVFDADGSRLVHNLRADELAALPG